MTSHNATAEILDPPLLPGGYGRANMVVGERAPVVRSGSGCRLLDEYGDEKIDLNSNFTALLHGHAHPLITEAATRALEGGASFGLPNSYELEHARSLIDRIPWAEQVRYTNSGTEAVMTAIRVARAATGRDKVVIQRPAYHGTSSTVLPALSDAARRGVPAAVAEQLVVIET
ncbi:MAG: aminotransferase class III-fold pyridoxal phosphate-dependent enzyme, partial [Gemmatimonadota bacterium]